MVKPKRKILRLYNNIAHIPNDMAKLISLEYGYKVKGKRKYSALMRIDEVNAFKGYVYGKQNKKTDFKVFTMTDQYIFIPAQLNLKTLLIKYLTEKQYKTLSSRH